MRNPHQNTSEKWLFVCSRNKRRSLTAEKMLAPVDGIDARSAGTQPGARVALTSGLIRWADVVFWMEKSHLGRARERFGEEIEAAEMWCCTSQTTSSSCKQNS